MLREINEVPICLTAVVFVLCLRFLCLSFECWQIFGILLFDFVLFALCLVGAICRVYLLINVRALARKDDHNSPFGKSVEQNYKHATLPI